MSIEQTLGRIAAALEILANAKTEGKAPLTANPGGPPAAPMPGPSGTGPGQVMPPVAAAPAPAAPVATAPVATAPVATAPAPAAPAPAAPVATAAPLGAPPEAQASRDIAALDQARDAANRFHRAHPERAGEIWAIITQVGGSMQGSPSGFDSIPAGREAQALQLIQALGA